MAGTAKTEKPYPLPFPASEPEDNIFELISLRFMLTHYLTTIALNWLSTRAHTHCYFIVGVCLRFLHVRQTCCCYCKSRDLGHCNIS